METCVLSSKAEFKKRKAKNLGCTILNSAFNSYIYESNVIYYLGSIFAQQHLSMQTLTSAYQFWQFCLLLWERKRQCRL